MKKILTIGGVGARSLSVRRAIIRQHKCNLSMSMFCRR